ncbi:MAG: crotonase/enoyl-CoA hydratase family protein [Hyphomonas sp.]
MDKTISTERTGRNDEVLVVTIERPGVRNAVNAEAADALYEAFKAFNSDGGLHVAILTGAGGNFCAGADLKAISAGHPNRFSVDGEYGPMGPTRLELSKPVIAAVDGYAVAGGLELAIWCDLRVVSPSAKFGVFCRRFGVPLIDGGTVRLPRLIGHSRAMDMILTGREVDAAEALQMGLANYATPDESALPRAIELAEQVSAFPQVCMRNDRMSAMRQWSLSLEEALHAEGRLGRDTLRTGSAASGASEFAGGKGRNGHFD